MGDWYQDENGVERWREYGQWTWHTRDGANSPPPYAPPTGPPMWGPDPTQESSKPSYGYSKKSTGADGESESSGCGCLILLIVLIIWYVNR